MIYFYVILSIALIPILENFFDILKQSYSWWLVPLLIIGFFITMVLIHLLFVVLNFRFMSYDTDPKKGQKYYRGLVNATISLLVPLVRVNINLSGMLPEEVPTDRKMMFVCNHQHDFDPAVIWHTFPNNDIGFIGKKEIYTTMPLIGRVMHKLHGLAIDRENNREGAKTIIKAINLIKEDTASIAVFPEGYTSFQCELLPFRNGVFKIALKSKAPIVICALSGTRQIPKRMLRKKTEVDFCICGILYPEDYENLSTNEIGEIVRSKMAAALKKMRPGLE
jgi:1-acyl-sn-glycerol-3-phosphate acyltransferase